MESIKPEPNEHELMNQFVLQTSSEETESLQTSAAFVEAQNAYVQAQAQHAQLPLFPGQEQYTNTYGMDVFNNQSNLGGTSVEATDVAVPDAAQPAQDETKKDFRDPKVYKYKCMICGKSFPTGQRLKIHSRGHTGERPYKCDKCGKAYTSGSMLKIHIRSHTGEKPYKCMVCDKAYTSAQLLRVHSNLHTKSKTYPCERCGREFLYAKSHKYHMDSNTCTGDKAARMKACKDNKCDLCDKTFTTNSQLVVHRRSHTGERPYACKQCSKCFYSANHLRMHMITHSTVRKHVCDTCGASFKHQNSLRIHRTIHTGVIAVRCETCGEGFGYKQRYQYHLKTSDCGLIKKGMKPIRKDGSRNFPCNICCRIFNSLQYLGYHYSRNHKQDFPYRCEICRWGFKGPMELKHHRRDHEIVNKMGGRNSAEMEQLVARLAVEKRCRACDGVVQTDQELAEHYETHWLQGDLGAKTAKLKKDYECLICKRKFNMYGSYKYHRDHKVCTKPKQPPCRKCGQTFTDRNELLNHQLYQCTGVKLEVKQEQQPSTDQPLGPPKLKGSRKRKGNRKPIIIIKGPVPDAPKPEPATDDGDFTIQSVQSVSDYSQPDYGSEGQFPRQFVVGDAAVFPDPVQVEGEDSSHTDNGLTIDTGDSVDTSTAIIGDSQPNNDLLRSEPEESGFVLKTEGLNMPAAQTLPTSVMSAFNMDMPTSLPMSIPTPETPATASSITTISSVVTQSVDHPDTRLSTTENGDFKSLLVEKSGAEVLPPSPAPSSTSVRSTEQPADDAESCRPSKTRFQCASCKHFFKSQRFQQQHMARRLCCSACGRYFCNKHNYQYHVNHKVCSKASASNFFPGKSQANGVTDSPSIQPDTASKVEKSEQSTQTCEQLNPPASVEVGPKPQSCDHCGITFDSAILYMMHVGYHSPADPKTCAKCEKRYETSVEFFMHLMYYPHLQ